jgi:hypothetical protein
MPRSAQEPQFFRTLRVGDVDQVGVLASVLGIIARHAGSIGDIRTVSQGGTAKMRDLDVLVESLAELDGMPEITVLEVRDEVLSAHVSGKICVVSKLPIDTFAELGHVYAPGVGEVLPPHPRGPTDGGPVQHDPEYGGYRERRVSGDGAEEPRAGGVDVGAVGKNNAARPPGVGECHPVDSRLGHAHNCCGGQPDHRRPFASFRECGRGLSMFMEPREPAPKRGVSMIDDSDWA